ncbi:MAG: hypothetical protein NUV69_05425 [Candidatus Curtissbacteria bacterium]|nr:hypothetical protein [Candidatus Curtissbacteria bacterium]
MERPAPDVEKIAEQMLKFANMGNESGVNNVILEGVPSVRGVREATFGYFPLALGREAATAVGQVEPDLDYESYLEKILAMEISPEVQALTPDNKRQRDHMERFTVPNLLPSHVITFGRSDGQEVVTLHMLIGISPRTALKEMQRTIKQELQRANFHKN